MKTIYNVEQGTNEWLHLRKGIITSTIVKTLITPKFKIAENDKTRKSIYKIASERITEYLEDSFLSYDMERGNFEEPLARDLYNENNKNSAKQVGFITNVFNGVNVGFSPDGVVNEDGIIEIKSAKQSIQVERIVLNEVPEEHLAQIHFGMLVSGAQWCDFISYSNGMEMLVIRVEKDDAIQKVLIEAITIAETKILETIESYKNNSKNFKKAPRVAQITNEITI